MAHRCAKFENDADVFTLAVQAKHTRELAREILFKLASVRTEQGEIGWSLHPDSVGNGYVIEAAHALLMCGFALVGFQRVFAHLIENGCVNGRWRSEYIYAILASEHAKTRAN